ncbi:MAG TPA: glycosyltransferase 87 family protein [Gaiellaceae bacterium]|nr:glycosyltransferase 87 family protein [Gaiellaceae bacterium]
MTRAHRPPEAAGTFGRAPGALPPPFSPLSALGAAALVVVVWLLLHVGWYPHGQIVDYPVYRAYGDAIVHRHAVPYRDFRLEYQPAALPFFAIPAALEGHDFRTVFQALMALCHLALVLAVLRTRGRAAAAAAALAPLLLGSVVLSRFDLWPAALAAGALWLLVRGNPPESAVVLATGFAAKLWPAVLAPVVCIWLWRREGRRAVAVWAGTALATAAAWFLPFLVVGARGVGHSFYLQLARPLQIESLGATIFVAFHNIAGIGTGVVSNFGSQNVAGPGVHEITLATTALELLAIVACWVLFVRGEPTFDRLLVACAASTTALLAFGKVFSPQYMIWLFALVPLAGRLVPLAVYGIGLVLTQVYFPRRYWELATGLYRLEVGIVLLRDLAVVALLCVLLYALQGSRATSREAASAAVS